MPKFEIWNSKELLGVACARNFLSACISIFEGVVGYDKKSNTYWGDKLYPTKQEKR